ncbi:ATP-binding protein [Pseudomonas sp. 2FE]|uniref:ATP-binding protein n=1 Tax=Pseudomonas sp. 2FE TaxID=2502190 RepID=UPI001C49978D|nr:ATP-binding protein [Pseudomonas sp. 2FE]
MKHTAPRPGITQAHPGVLPRWLLPILLLPAGVYTHWLVFQWGPADQQLWISNLLFPLSLIPVVALCWYAAARHHAAARRSWACVALALTAFLAGSLIWSYLQQAIDKPPFPSLADAFYLAFTPCLVLAFLSFPRPAFRPMEALRLGLDIAVITAAVGVYAWYFMLAPTILAFPGQPFAMVVGLAYPIGDLVLLSLLLLITLRQRRDEALKLETLLLGGGLGFMITADTFFFFASAAGTFTNASWYNDGWVGAHVLLALAAYASLFARPVSTRWRPGWEWPQLYLPYVAVTASYGLMMARAFSGHTLATSGVQWGTALVTLLVIARQIVTFAENARLARELKAFSHELERAKNTAEAANRAKSAFLAAMSHELRTPLNAVLGYAQILLRDRRLSERQALGLSTIQSSGQHLLMLINDILDLSKVEAGKLELSPGPVQLSDFLEVIADIIRVRAEQKSLRFQLEAAAELPAVLTADEKRLRQVLLNLLSNAVKFTDRGQVTLRVTQQGRSNGEVSLRFEVVDSGVGIAPDQLGAIFQPFEQVGELSRRAGGTGLGLAISRQLVRMMDSDIQVESGPGQGSKFCFELRLPVAEALRPSQAQHAVTGYDGPRRTVLVVDDVVANRALAMDLLGMLGFAVLEAENGEVALRLAEASVPDLILMDMVMPVLDGLETTRRARVLPALQAVPILIVSASATADDQADALAAGANAFVAKPIDQQKLLQEIGSLLHLSWRYDATQTESVGEPATEPAAPLLPPPAEELAALHQLALAGNLHELRLRAGQLAAEAPGYRPFADKLAQLAADFKSKAVLRLIEANLGGEAQP